MGSDREAREVKHKEGRRVHEQVALPMDALFIDDLSRRSVRQGQIQVAHGQCKLGHIKENGIGGGRRRLLWT